MPDEEDAAPAPEAESAGPRQVVTDARTFRALAHPVRLALLEVLGIEGPLTATEAGDRIGESPTTCSFHLRQLARFGFVEEAGGGRGRARPWRIASAAVDYSSVQDDPAAELAAGALNQMLRERQLQRYRKWLDARTGYPRAWQEAAFDSRLAFWLTPAELGELNGQLIDLLLPRVRERLEDPSARPVGALPVELLMFGYPLAPAPAEDEDRGSAEH